MASVRAERNARNGRDRGLVARERLTSRLLAAGETSIALVVAPAGYGKTTLIRQWDAADERPFVWVGLSDRHNDPAHLLESIARAVGEVNPIDQAVFDALSVPRPNISNVVVPRLIDALAKHQREYVLVLDDVHLVNEPASVSVLSTLAEQMPLGTQLALVSHTEPPIGVGRLRAHRRLVELHAHDLVMTRSEAAELLRAAGLELGPGAVKRLVERTEGWPAALYLATLTINGENDATKAIERFAGDDRMVADYLRDEFLARQSSDDVDFLIATSVLDRMTGPLCDAVLGCEGSAQTLRRLSRSNLLLVPLDRKDEQYRYHALMREMLASELHRLGEHREGELHARASRWYAGEGDLDRAIPHAISAGDLEQAGRFIWAKAADYESHGREATMRAWLNRFTEDKIAASPYLSLTMAANHTTRGDGANCDRWTATALSALASAPEAERGWLEAAAGLIRAGGAAREGIAKMGEDAARASALIPDEDPFYSMSRLLEGVAHHLAGDRDEARWALEEASHRAAASAPNIHTLALVQLALLELDERGAAGAALTLKATAHADRFGLNDYPTSALVFAVSALMRVRRGGVEEATRHSKRSAVLLERLTDFSPWYETETRIVLARALVLLDDASAARGQIAAAERLLRKTSDAVVLQVWLEEATREVESVAGLDGRWPLTKAELRLLHFLPSHLSFREIGEKLFVSTNTVKTQAQAIYRKLGVSSRAEAVACAEAAGLVRKGQVVPSVEEGGAATPKGL